jgi:hypothetical protein
MFMKLKNYTIDSFKTAWNAPKNANFEFTKLGLFYYILLQTLTSSLTIVVYVITPMLLSHYLAIHDMLLILLSFTIRIFHRIIASEFNMLSAGSYALSGPSVLIILLIITKGFTVEAQTQIGVNIFYIAEYKILIQSTLKMGTMYILSGSLFIDSIISFVLYALTKERSLKMIAIALQLMSLTIFLRVTPLLIQISVSV